ncbi:MAG: SPFH domain-containing protein [Oscillospiraceae bacterium]|nr:SPFH domain-containing protein [Oscillospiraceae bacterium]MDD6082634.1 SPFH domain-containing protein [Oscillospiraceae bacterium]
MGLIKIALGSVSSTLADQFKEFFYCDSIRNDVLVVKGQKRTGKGSGNHGSDNIISSGSGIAVADGQCMMIVEQGRVVDVCAVPGEYQYDMSSEPSLFTGSLGDGIIETLKTIGNRIAHGGDTGKDQRVYYFNTKEITDNKFGTQNPVPFRLVDNKIGLDIDTSVRCNGAYSYKITDPVLFYTNVCGNVAQEYNRSEIDSMMKTEFRDALQPAFAKISAMGIRYNELPGHTTELSNTMNEILSQKWSELRGISIVSVGINSITIPPEDEELIKNAQRTAMMRDPNFAAATLVDAQAAAMKTAAGNSAGTMAGFMNMNMAGAAGGFNAQNLFAMGQQQAASQQAAAPAGSWTCSCGTVNTGKFCSECASPKPAPAGQWTCSCGTVNTGKFCSECASPKPSAEWTCSCGAVNTGKFCSECASPRP